MSKQRPEEALQKAVIEMFGWAMPKDAIWHHSPNEGNRHVAFKKKLKEMGFQAGWPDIEILWRGHFIFIELKAPGKYASKAQRKLHDVLTIAGGKVSVCRTPEEVSAFLAMVMGTDWRANLHSQAMRSAAG